MPKTIKSHGGKRKGAHRPTLYDKPMPRIDVRLDEETVAFYTQQGQGNLSQGIRDYWRKASATKGNDDEEINKAKAG